MSGNFLNVVHRGGFPDASDSFERQVGLRALKSFIKIGQSLFSAGDYSAEYFRFIEPSNLFGERPGEGGVEE